MAAGSQERRTVLKQVKNKKCKQDSKRNDSNHFYHLKCKIVFIN